MTSDYPEHRKDLAENGILFSRVVKAGKRVYYIDVKRDRREEYYISMTESKRIKEGSFEDTPTFEKHKIFLYREDLLKFLTALTDAVQYVSEQRPLVPFTHTASSESAIARGTFEKEEKSFEEKNENELHLKTEFDFEF